MQPHPATSTPSTDTHDRDHPARERSGGRGRARALGALGAALALPAAAALAPFWAVAALTRRLPSYVRLEPANTLAWRELLHYVPELGWQTRPNLEAYCYADDIFRLTTDEEGWRGRLPLDDADLLVFGDSYAFGHGVNDDQVYTNYTGDVRAKALGSDGYSMVHAVLWMERLASRMVGKSAMWLVFPGNDLYDNLKPNYGRYRMPFARRTPKGWTIDAAHVNETPWPIHEEHPSYLTELARLCTPSPETDRALEAAGYLVERAAQICRRAEVDLTLLSVPRRAQIDPALQPDLRRRSPNPAAFDPTIPDKALEAHCATSGVRFVPLAQHLTPAAYQRYDIHWQPSGHITVGELMATIHREQWTQSR